MSYRIWLSFNNRAIEFQIPINPEQIEVAESGQGKSYDVVGLGEINVIGNPKLTEYSWSGIFPAQHYPWVVVDKPHPPHWYVRCLEEWMQTLRPIRFIFEGPAVNIDGPTDDRAEITRINTPVSIESFTWKEVAGSDGDIEYTLRLKKYLFYAAQRVQVVQPPGATQPALEKQPPPRPDEREVPATCTLVAGDTLWGLAQRCLGDGSRWPEIQQLNNITDAEIKTLQVGRVLRLPGGGPPA